MKKHIKVKISTILIIVNTYIIDLFGLPALHIDTKELSYIHGFETNGTLTMMHL